MLVDIFINTFILAALSAANFNFNGFINLGNLQDFNENQRISQLEQEAPQKIFTDYLDVVITAKSALAVDAKSGKVLYKRDMDKVLPIASLTKLMTALVFLDYNPGWKKEWSTKASDRRNGGIIYLNTDETLSLDNLFKTALIVSDNDSAMALSRASGLSENDFIAHMNAKAGELGLNNTKFTDPTGLLSSNKSTASDIAKLLNFALQNEAIRETTSTAYYEFEVKSPEKTRTVKLKNTDWLIGGYLNIIGGKTGSLESAGNCLAVKIKGKQDQEIIVVALGSETNPDRFQDVKAVSDWVFNNYQWN